MSENVETSVAQIGLRDLLFYVLPGSVLLIGIGGLLGVEPQQLKDYVGLAPSVGGLLVAYLLGQCAYPLGYLVRAAMEPFQRGMDKRNETFRAAYRSSARESGGYFSVEIFRYRTLARFCSVMVGPVLLSMPMTVLGAWSLAAVWKWIICAAGTLAAFGFLYRYHRYEARYRAAVLQSAT